MGTFTANSDLILQFLRSLELFDGVNPAGLVSVARAARLHETPKGTFIFVQDDPASAVFLVWQGVIAIQIETPSGHELIINEMGAGDCFGELGMITGRPRSACAEALVDSAVLRIPGTTFLAVLEQDHALSLNLLKITARRLQSSSQREEALAFYDAQQRLARQLLKLDERSSGKGYLTISQEELGQRTGLTRQTAAEILGGWRARGWLLTGRGHIMLLNRHELGLLARDFQTK